MDRQYWKATEEKVMILFCQEWIEKRRRELARESKSDYLEPNFLPKADSMKQRKRCIAYSDNAESSRNRPKIISHQNAQNNFPTSH